MTTDIANRLCAYRKYHNLSQEDLAEKLGVSRQAVSKWERAEASPDTDNLILLSKVYQVSLDDLLYSDPQPEADDIIGTPSFQPVEAGDKPPNRRAWLNRWYRFPYPLLCFVLYLTVGAFHILGGWAWGWLILLTIPLYYTLGDAISTRNASAFCFPVLVVLVYLILGLSLDWWHPGWILFCTIPLYYCLCDL